MYLLFASRSKAKAEPRRPTSARSQRWRKYLRLQADPRLKQKQRRPSTTCSSSRTIPILEKNMYWYWTRNSIRSSVPSGKKTKHSSSARRITSRRRWGERILQTERWSSEQIWALSILSWWCTEEQDGRRRRQQEKISILYWPVRTRNSSPSSSSWSVRTQSHWSFTGGQNVDSEQFLRVHLTYWMCSQFTLCHKFRIDSGRTKFKQGKTDGILYSRESHAQGSPRSKRAWSDQTTSCILQAKVESAPRYGVLCRYSACSTARIEVLSNKIERLILHERLPAYCILKAVMMETWEIIYQKVYVSPRPPPTISYKDNWTCDLDSDVARSSKDIQRIELKPNTQLSSTWRPVTWWRE